MIGIAARTGGGLRAPSGARATIAFIAALTVLVGVLALCANRGHNGDTYLELSAGRFIAQHGLVWHDPFPTVAAGRQWLNQQWLSELAFYNLARDVGMTGLTLLYALMLGIPLGALLYLCRRKGLAMLAVGAAFYFPGVLQIVHPRAAVFSLVGFSFLVVLLLRAWPVETADGRREVSRRSRVLAGLAIPALFALWTNLHGGFVAGLLLIGLFGAGTLVDVLRQRQVGDWWRGTRRLLVLGLVGVAALAATLATPLGPKVWEYVLAFRNPAISLATQEWESAIHVPQVLLYLVLAAGLVWWLWSSMPRPRPVAPLVIAGGFLTLALYSQRNLLFLGPVIFYVVAVCVPDRAAVRVRLAPAVVVGLAALVAAGIWGFALGPARTAAYLKPQLVDAVLRHPPPSGRIASVAGVGSYLLWRSSKTPVMVNGWLEHFTASELRGAHGVMEATPDGLRYIRRWGVRGVITKRPETISTLLANGFHVVLTTPEGTYLAR